MRALVTWVGRGLGALVTVALAAVIVLGLFGLGFSGGVGDNYVDLQDVDGPQGYDVTVTGVAGDTVTIEGGSAEFSRDGVWGLEYPGGYGRIGDVLTETDGVVIRTFTLAEGADPAPGTPARLDTAAWRGGPEAAGLPFREVSYSTELGEYPAWLAGPSADTWLIVVHHKASRLDEGLRLATIAADAGAATLSISYRNDRDAPAGPSRTYQWGATEWRDLEGAVRYALSQGATQPIVAGYGMGGSIVLSFLQHSELAAEVGGAILDSPVIDLEATVAHDLSQDQLGAVFDLPTAFNVSARVIAGWRFDLDWGALDYGATPAAVPTLIFHGDADAVTPLTESQAYAAANPALVQLIVTEDAGFAESWNVDADRYREAVLSFLEGL